MAGCCQGSAVRDQQALETEFFKTVASVLHIFHTHIIC